MFISVLENFSSISRVIFSSPEVEVQPELNIFNNSSFVNNNPNNKKINIPSIEIIDTDEIPIPDSKKNSETSKSDQIDYPVPCTSFESHFFQLFCQPETISNVQNPQTISNVQNRQSLSNKDSRPKLENQSETTCQPQNISSEDIPSKSEINRTEPQDVSSENVERYSLESQNLSESQIKFKTDVYSDTLKKGEESEFDDFEELIFAPDLSKVLIETQDSVKDQNANDSGTLKQNVDNNYGLGFDRNSPRNVVKPEKIHQTFGTKSESFEFEEVIYADDDNIEDCKKMTNPSNIIADDKTSREMINSSNIESNLINKSLNIELNFFNGSSTLSSEHSNLDQDSSKQIGNKNITNVNVDVNNIDINNVNIDNISRNISNDSNQNGEKNT
jgi:hypothetical protein